jgi:hypothetical protein
MAPQRSPDRASPPRSPKLRRPWWWLGIGVGVGVLLALRLLTGDRELPPSGAAAPIAATSRVPSPPAADTIDKAPRETAPSYTPERRAEFARLRFLDAKSGSGVGPLAMNLAAPTRAAVMLVTDVAGLVDVPPGRWSITMERSDIEIDTALIDVAAGDDRIVWVSPTTACRVIVRSEAGHALSGACVSLERDGAWLLQQRGITDRLGVFELIGVPTAFDGRILVWMVGFLPAQVPFAAIDPETRELVVVLAPNAGGPGLTIECVDDLEQPVAGIAVHVHSHHHGDRRIWAGATGRDGRLDLGPLAEHLPGELWLSGPILTTRRELEDSVGTSPVRIRVAVPVPGTLALASRAARAGERIDVRIADAGKDGAGSRLDPIGRWVVAEGDGFPFALPRNREVRVTCFAEDGRRWSGSYTATAAGWRLPMEFGGSADERLVTLLARESAIGRVAGALVPYHVEHSRHAVILHVPPGQVHFELTSAASPAARLAFSGAVLEDTVVEVRFPSVQPVDFDVVDDRGRPISDVQIELRRTSHLARELVAGTALKQFVANNLIAVVPGADGRVRAELMAGNYDVRLRHLQCRDRVGTWRPQQSDVLTVPGPRRVTIVCARPRRVVLSIAADAQLPRRWQIHGEDGAFLGSQTGRLGVLWCSADRQVLEVRTPGGGQKLARVEIPASDVDTRLELGRETLLR